MREQSKFFVRTKIDLAFKTIRQTKTTRHAPGLGREAVARSIAIVASGFDPTQGLENNAMVAKQDVKKSQQKAESWDGFHSTVEEFPL